MSLHIRGDFHSCPNPLSLEPYTICEDNCSFCFIKVLDTTIFKKKARNGFKVEKTETLTNAVKKAFRTEKESKDPLVMALRHGLPVIVGRRCEPFCKSERMIGATYRILELLHNYDVSTVVETKGEAHYIDDLSHFEVGVNVTITPGDDELARKLMEPTLYSERWKFAKKLKAVGLWVGITGEPIISGVNDSKRQLTNWAEKCSELKPTHVNFGELRYATPMSLMAERISKTGFNLADIMEEKRLNWLNVANAIFQMLHEKNLSVTTPDWINFGLMNDTESCCGFSGVKYKLHHFTFQHALLEFKRKGKVYFKDMERECLFGEKYLAKFRKIWNGKKGYFNLSDVNGISRIGRDGNGDVIYGKTRTLKEVFKD